MGALDLLDRAVDAGANLFDVTVGGGVLDAVAGETDVLAPVAAVHHVSTLLSGSPEVTLATAPGGHLGVLTGRAARRTTWARLDQFLGAHDVAGTRHDVAEAGWRAEPAPAEAA
jgi:polyhydroxyalkanoate synthase